MEKGSGISKSMFQVGEFDEGLIRDSVLFFVRVGIRVRLNN